MLRTPVVTARGLADSLTVTPQAALGLLRQLIAVGVVREATGRALARLHHDIDGSVTPRADCGGACVVNCSDHAICMMQIAMRA
jgi:hypothetical protein